MIAELAIAVKDPTKKAQARIDLAKLQLVYDNNETKHWTTLSIGLDLATYKAKRANAYYVLLLSGLTVVGYLLLFKNKLELGKVSLKGWTVIDIYVKPEAREVGFMRRVYDMILTKGRLISAPVHTPKGMAMWVSRIKTDNRHFYLVVTGKGRIIPVDSHTVDNMRRTIWDGNPKTVLVCALKSDQKIKKLVGLATGQT